MIVWLHPATNTLHIYFVYMLLSIIQIVSVWNYVSYWWSNKLIIKLSIRYSDTVSFYVYQHNQLSFLKGLWAPLLLYGEFINNKQLPLRRSCQKRHTDSQILLYLCISASAKCASLTALEPVHCQSQFAFLLYEFQVVISFHFWVVALVVAALAVVVATFWCFFIRKRFERGSTFWQVSYTTLFRFVFMAWKVGQSRDLYKYYFRLHIYLKDTNFYCCCCCCHFWFTSLCRSSDKLLMDLC